MKAILGEEFSLRFAIGGADFHSQRVRFCLTSPRVGKEK
jgi:hypothetical protein